MTLRTYKPSPYSTDFRNKKWMEEVGDDLYNVLNYKESETPTGGVWIDGNPIFRIVVDVGSLPNTTSSSTAHGVSPVTMVRLYGIATNGTTNFPLPYVDTTASSAIEVKADGTNVIVITAANYSTYTGFMVLEYTKA